MAKKKSNQSLSIRGTFEDVIKAAVKPEKPKAKKKPKKK